METSPTVNSSIRSSLILLGGIGVSKGWWDQNGLEGIVDQLIAFGGAALAIGAFAWGIWAKRPESKEAEKIADTVISRPKEPL